MREASIEVVRRLRRAGHTAAWVGGCVRDLLLGFEPREYDVATSAQPEAIAALFEAVREVGRAFAVQQVRVGESWIEVASFRAEGAYSDSRHPDSVRPADLRADAERRDFTINALYMDPETGAIEDLVGGREDLARRVLRCVGDPSRRLQEDALRLLRAVRFACRYELEIETGTYRALVENAPRLGRVAAERIRDELFAMLTGPDPRRALELLADTGLLATVAPELLRLRGCAQSPRNHPEGDVWVHTLRMLERMHTADVELALGVLLHDIGKPDARRQQEGEVVFHGHEQIGQEVAAGLMRRLAVPNQIQAEVQMLIGQHMRFLHVDRMRQSTRRRFVLQAGFDRLLELHRLDALSSRGDLTSWDLCRREIDALAAEKPPLRPLLSGHDLQALGYAAGPRLGTILAALVDAQLEGAVADRTAAAAWVREHYTPDTEPRCPTGP
jgi:poly(A) polymerase